MIQLLPEHVANQIAAGEVIQRPSSAVKELLENAVDAKSTKIQLIIKNAGSTLIQVIDNGIGMSEQDAEMCFKKHATSKIKSAAFSPIIIVGALVLPPTRVGIIDASTTLKDFIL